MSDLIALEYPFDWKVLNRKKKSLKKQLEIGDGFLEKRIAILGGSTTNDIKLMIELFLLKEKIKPIFYESEYNQYYEDALFGEKLSEFNPDIIYIHTTIKNIQNFPNVNQSEELNLQLFNAQKNHWQEVWGKLWEKYQCPIIQNNVELPLYRFMGNGESYLNGGNVFFVHQLNDFFAKSAKEKSYLYLNDIHYLSSLVGLKNWFDNSLWFNYKYALSFEAMPYLAHSVASIIKSIYGKNKKVLALDLDNTLWGGVIGDVGENGIKIGKETAIGEAYTEFQKYIQSLKNQGVLLSIASKNDIENAIKGLEHPEMILKKDDFAVIKANWQPKSDNLLDTAQEINVGIDSFVFMDDNPAERELVKTQLAMVSVPNIGDCVEFYIDHLSRNGFFEVTTFSKEDAERSLYYEQNKIREQEKMNFADYQDYLLSLNMTAEIQASKPIHLDRIYQLINKTNQFNLTTKRYTKAEVETCHQQDDVVILYGRLIDKFGDNGLISVIIGEHQQDALYIPLWIMSCRVLKRQMEYAMLDELVDYAKIKGLKYIVGEYIPSAKNKMVENHYQELGFDFIRQENDSYFWRLDIAKYTAKNQVIKIVNP